MKKEFLWLIKYLLDFLEIKKLGLFGTMNKTNGFFSVLDIIGVIRKEDNYEKCRNYWKYLKTKLKKKIVKWLVPLPS